MKDAIDYLKCAWGVRLETLTVISKVLRGEMNAEDLARSEERVERQAAGRAPRTTGGVAVLNLRGLIIPQPSFLSLLFGGGGGGLIGFRESFRQALAADDIAAILINVDSPGGLTDLVPETAAEIRAARGQKPIVAIANTMAASAAYWIAAQADELVITPSGEVGSIGIFMAHEDWSSFDEQLGVKTTLISAGKYKTEGNPYEPLTEEAAAAFQETVDELYAMFTSDVAKGRGTTPSAVRSGYGEGRMLSAKRAAAAGMVDRIDTFEETVAKLVGKPQRSRSNATLYQSEPPCEHPNEAEGGTFALRCGECPPCIEHARNSSFSSSEATAAARAKARDLLTVRPAHAA